MSETPREDHPFADIIDAFERIAADAAAIGAPAPTLTDPATEPAVAVPAPRAADWPASIAPTSPPRPLLPKVVGGLLVLALTAGFGLLVVHGSGGDEAPTPAPAPAPAALVETGIPAQEEYAGVLADVATATDLAGLAEAADRADDLARTFATLSAPTEAGTGLILAEAASLQALAGLDGVTEETAGDQFPALAATLGQAQSRVRRARRVAEVTDPATDPATAVGQVVQVVAPLALDGLEAQLDALVTQAGRATRTAGLREVAAAAALDQADAEDTVTALDGHPRLQTRARAIESVMSGLAGLEDIDGDHLDLWASARPQLVAGLAGLGRPTDALAGVDAMVDTARLLMATWRELAQESQAPTRAEVADYADAVDPALDKLVSAMGSLPGVTADTAGDFALTTRFYDALQSVSDAAARVAAAGAPAELRDAQRRIADFASRAKAAAVQGHDVALAAENAVATLGQQPGWPAFAKALDRLGDPRAARDAWRSAVGRAEAAAPTTTGTPAKPDV